VYLPSLTSVQTDAALMFHASLGLLFRLVAGEHDL
jgi:hypothetical protein